MHIWESLVRGVSSKFPEVNLMSCVTSKDSVEDLWQGFLCVCILNPTSPFTSQEVWAGLAGPQRRPSFALCPWGGQPPNSYAKSTSPNCRIGLQAKFFLSPLTTAVNYKSSRGVFECDWRRCRNAVEGGKKNIPGNISSYITAVLRTSTQAQWASQEDLPGYSKSLLHRS